MSHQSRLRESDRRSRLGLSKPSAACSKKREPYKPSALSITDLQRASHQQNETPRHLVSAKKGGRVPGIPFRLRKYPHGKHAVEIKE